MEVVALIPARYGSRRFPGKPLALLRGKPMIQHVYHQACQVPGVDRVMVATDDGRIAAAVSAVGGQVAMTRADHQTGTDRLAEVAEGLAADIIVNVQGDLPFFPPTLVGDAVNALKDSPGTAMATVKTPIQSREEWQNPNVVKVVTDRDGFAVYFSRSPIPFYRQMPSPAHRGSFRHIGLYVYRRDFLLALSRLAPTPLEEAEQLEQLRALEWGYKIRVTETERPTVEVDTPLDLCRAEEMLP